MKIIEMTPVLPKEEIMLMSSGWVWGTRRAVCEAV